MYVVERTNVWWWWIDSNERVRRKEGRKEGNRKASRACRPIFRRRASFRCGERRCCDRTFFGTAIIQWSPVTMLPWSIPLVSLESDACPFVDIVSRNRFCARKHDTSWKFKSLNHVEGVTFSVQQWRICWIFKLLNWRENAVHFSLCPSGTDLKVEHFKSCRGERSARLNT